MVSTLPVLIRCSLAPWRKSSRCWAVGAIRSAVAAAVQSSVAKNTYRCTSVSSAKRAAKGTVSRNAKSTWTAGQHDPQLLQQLDDLPRSAVLVALLVPLFHVPRHLRPSSDDLTCI